jgi:dienelactone hydrolase
MKEGVTMLNRRDFGIYLTVSLLLVGGALILAEAVEILTFKSTHTTPAGDPLMLAGKLTKPQGNGPFPAVVLLHGCAGIWEYRDDLWAKRFADWGYVALQVDSFKPRSLSSICDDVTLLISMLITRVKDAYDAKSYLAGLPFVDRNRIAVMGWSHGGWTILYAINQKRDDPFNSAIAFYPYCDQPLLNVNAPLLILIGEEDDWTPANMCSTQMPTGQIGHEVILKIYPNSHHGFDGEGIDTFVSGHKIRSNPVARADAIIQIKTFLNKHLK